MNDYTSFRNAKLKVRRALDQYHEAIRPTLESLEWLLDDSPEKTAHRTTNQEKRIFTPKPEPWRLSMPSKRRRDKIIWELREAGEIWQNIAEKADCGISTARDNYTKMKKIS